ncbi:D-threo-aldose 1-dehydrogenase [Shimia isoporae]|uniref:D-threo-aldose 1-dehydrogenase n=1 Tax=Shimia isoporae TaxID=647720 RepID=A0A4R1NPA2_9RHOB|nr:aldo/keto reductase [Shimia isoporae]TCL10297.1 D-threo-aldose 1-dehydrogenase [Shimia isoporae]
MLDERHRLSFGCSALAGLYHPISEAGSRQVLQAAWDEGFRYFDTAPHYGNGMSERRVGDFLRDKDGWLLSTKVGRILTPDRYPRTPTNGFFNPLPFQQHFDFSYDGIMRSVEGSFQRLGLNRIDILYVHDIGDPAVGTDTPEHISSLLEGGQRALVELKSSGVIKAFGLGVNTTRICEDLVGRMDLDLILLAGRYTLLDQSATKRLFPLCAAHDVGIVIGGVYNSGILATGAIEGAFFDYAPANTDVLEQVRELEAICARFEVPLASAALQYPARHPLVASTLLGTSKVSSVSRNLRSWSHQIPEELWSALEAKFEAQSQVCKPEHTGFPEDTKNG